jgi:hypothetical protein
MTVTVKAHLVGTVSCVENGHAQIEKFEQDFTISGPNKAFALKQARRTAHNLSMELVEFDGAAVDCEPEAK